MKVLSFRFLVLGSITAAIMWMGKRQGHFNREITTLETSLLQHDDKLVVDDKYEYPVRKPLQAWDDLPNVVQRYFLHTFASFVVKEDDDETDVDAATDTQPVSPSYSLPMSFIPSIQSLQFHQKGTFRLNSDWFPFVARQTVSCNANNPGFVWEANMSFLQHTWWSDDIVKVRVVDALVRGRAYLNASLWGFVYYNNLGPQAFGIVRSGNGWIAAG